MSDLTSYFDCNPISIIEFNDDLEALCDLGYVTKRKARRNHFDRGLANREEYSINDMLARAIVKREALPVIKKEEVNNILEFLEKWEEQLDQRANEVICTDELICECKVLFMEYAHFPLVGTIEKMGLKSQELIVYLQLIWEHINGSTEVELNSICEKLFDKSARRLRFMQDVSEGKNPLVKMNLVELEEKRFLNESEIKLSPKSLQILADNEMMSFVKLRKRDNIIEPENITQRELIFNEMEMKHLMLLNQMLEEQWLNATRERLAKKNLPVGVTVLLHGAPGTGKTESVLQVARKTGREIMKIEISQSKSMWFGESEKIIKRIFTDYRAYCKQCPSTPILLFNEADAILSRRSNNIKGAVGQTENAIQNILLEELENFEGIFMATTNLVGNLDNAFDRRFLFKIKFGKPDAEIRTRIWKQKMPSLSDEECSILARRFDFSGGEINNVVRKMEIESIIHGYEPGLDNAIDFCTQESTAQQSAAVGFKF
ncbi:ATP-binding protein [Geofilum rubicundum]|uniref:ATP-binding protein n=1 Tax=Geofilum rubicundum TaxID=472113 RepID=UPI0007840C08|nr:ATP-binding protein [Geofilum rubicundum]